MSLVVEKIEIIAPSSGRIVVDREDARKIYEALKAMFERA